MIVKQCVLCAHKKLKLVFKRQFYEIVQCQKCSFAMLKNYPILQETKKIYQKEYFNDKISPEFLFDAQKKITIIKDYLSPSDKILDFGCGTGNFIKIAKKNHFSLFGYDISNYAAKIVSKKYHIPCFSSNLSYKTFKKGYFDAITCFDVIEHAPNFKKIIDFFYLWLKPQGLLFLTTPNIKGWDAKIFGRFWYGYQKIPEHINYFSPQSISFLIEKSGFKILKIKNWGFVRSIDFILNRFNQNNFFIKFMKKITKFLKINKKIFFFPLTDMIIIAKKI